MKENKSPRTILFKKTMVVLCVLSGIEILAIIFFGLYYNLFITKVHNNSKGFSISAEDIKANQDTNTTSNSELANLEILPSDYDTLTKNFGVFTPHELTTYLRYSEVLKTKDTTNLTNGYKYLQDSQLNILIPQTYISQYILTEVQSISQAMINENKSNEDILPYLEMGIESSIENELSSCIKENMNTFLKEETCAEQLSKIHDESFLPTLNFLTASLRFKPLESENEYDTYVNNHMYMYQMNKTYTQVASSENSYSYSNDIYLDLDYSQIHKIQLIINYLKSVDSKLDNFSDATKKKISNLDTLVGLLVAYKYGDTVPTAIEDLVNNQLLNLTTNENSYAQASTQLSFLIKSFNLNNEIKTFIAPIYTFEGKDKTAIPSLTFEINDNNFDEPYDVTPSVQKKGSVRIPIFMYHQIAPVPAGQNQFKSGLYVDPLDFEKQMAYLVKNNYKTISAQEYANILKTGKNPTQKTTMLTFDDGVLNQYTTGYPILKKYGLTGVFYIISQRSGINQAQTKEMSDNGMDIGSHSAHHPDLTKVTDPSELSAEIVSSRYSLQNATGKPVTSFCYPGCGYNSTTLSYVASAGYTIAVSCGATIDNYPGHAITLSRVHAFGSMDSFKNLLSGQPGW
jgi:peptidoglycan/xylan/chitin deacetylase (PgdA/CDA1 family)